MKKLVSLILAAVLVLSLCACGGSKDNPAVGVYKATSMVEDGTDLIQMMKGLGQEFDVYLVLNADGTGRMEMEGEDPTDLKWDDKNISGVDDEDALPYTFSNDTITLEEDGTTMTFVKLTGDELAAYQKKAA